MVEVQTFVFLVMSQQIIQMTITFQLQPSCQLSRLDHKLNQFHQNVNTLSVHKVVRQRAKQAVRDLVCKKAVSNQDVVSHVPSVTFHGQPQRKGLSPAVSLNKIKVVKGVSYVSQCLSAPSVPNVPHVATEIRVGGRLQSFWQVWQGLQSNPRVVSILKEGYTLPLIERPPLCRFPLIVSKYANPLKNKSLSEALSSLIQKEAMERVVVKSSLALYNRLFLVPKPNRKW